MLSLYTFNCLSISFWFDNSPPFLRISLNELLFDKSLFDNVSEIALKKTPYFPWKSVKYFFAY